MSAKPFPSIGIHLGVSEADYHAQGHEQGMLSKSLLWKFLQSPYKWKFGPGFKSTRGMAVGSLRDCLVLTPSAYAEDFVISPYDAFRTNEAKAWKESTEKGGKTIVTQKEVDEAQAAVGKIRSHSIAGSILASAATQVSVVIGGTEQQTKEKFRCKCRIDILPDANGPYKDWIFDLKITNSIPFFGKIVAQFGYEVQAALYIDVYNLVADENRTKWGFILQEDTAPGEVAVMELDPEDIAAGRETYLKALALWCQCARDNNYPSLYEDEIGMVKRPNWARKGEDQ